MKSNTTELAPIVLFTYNRPWHTKKTIAALQKNNLANLSKIYIFSDGGKDDKSWEKVKEVRSHLETVGGFKEIHLIFQETNLGLAESIISGVTSIIKKFGKIIVLEDDHVTSHHFLEFMNSCLNIYANEQDIWQVSGWAFPIRHDDLEETVKHKVMNCWGWGTWENKWQHFEKKPEQLIEKYSREDIEEFCLNGADPNLWKQVLSNFNGSMNSWAVFWHEIIYKNQGFYLNPTKTLLKNIGIDGSGVHHGNHNYFKDKLNSSLPQLENTIKTNSNFNERVELFYFRYNYNLRKNPNYVFSVNLNKIYGFLKALPINEKFIIYGAGTGLELILNQIKEENILFVIDSNPKAKNKKIIIKSLKEFSVMNDLKSRILITPFGRSEEIIDNLIKNYNVCNSRIISLDILN